jgi:cytochrome b pre-mRNA-processing protein 3
MLNLLRRTSPTARTARSLYEQLNAASRQPVFFREYAIPDTVDGRFDVVALHGWLALSRLNAGGQTALAQALSNTVFVAFDEALRDMGNGDMGMGPRMKKLGHAFNGRCQAYEAAATDEGALAEVIIRNIYRGEPGHEAQALGLARYALAARAALAPQDPAAGHLEFGPVPTTFA